MQELHVRTRTHTHTYTVELNSAHRLQWRLPLPEFNRSTLSTFENEACGRTDMTNALWIHAVHFVQKKTPPYKIIPFFSSFLFCCAYLSGNTIAYVARKLFENKPRLFSVPGDLNCFQFNPRVHVGPLQYVYELCLNALCKGREKARFLYSS